MVKEYDLDINILHWAHRSSDGALRSYNDLLINCINSIKRADIADINLTTKKIKVNNHIYVIYNCDDWYYDDLVKRIGKIDYGGSRGFSGGDGGKIILIKDYKNKGASGARNIAVENAIKNEREGINKNGFFVILDNDMKVPFNWSTNLVSELIHAENYFGVGCTITYDQMPYLEEGVIRADDSSNGACYKNIMKLGPFIEYCRKYGLPCDGKGNVSCKKAFDSGDIKMWSTGVTYSGWRLSNFISSTNFVREAEKVGKAGFSSEELSGFGREDLEWAVRVFKTPCVMFESHTVFLQHLMAFTSSFVYSDRLDNAPILQRLLGNEVISGFKDGVIWPKLRQEQMTKYGYKG